MTPEKFYESYREYAERNEKENGVPALVTLAQAALESGWGKHAPGNNFFGIKDSSSANFGIQILNTTEYIHKKKVGIKAKFETYPSPFECFEHHANLLKKRFPKAFRHKDPVAFIMSVQNDHGYMYATDPKYVRKIVKIINVIKIEEEKKRVTGNEINHKEMELIPNPDGKNKKLANRRGE